MPEEVLPIGPTEHLDTVENFQPDERCDYRSKWGVHERCIRTPHPDADHWFTTPQEAIR